MAEPLAGDRVRCTIVGAGGITRAMLKRMGNQPWYETAAAVDVRPQALQEVRQQLAMPELPVFTDLDEALANVPSDAVLVNTPSEWHYRQTRAALEAGRHALVAKPVTNDYEQAVELVELAAARGLTLSVGQQMRYNRHYTAVRDFVQSGQLGRAEAAWFMNSKPRPQAANLAQMGQPALYENACHHFDSFLAVFAGHTPEWIACDGFIPSWSPYVGPCMVNALIRFSGGLHLAYHGGFSSRAPMYEFRIEGSDGALRCQGLHMSNDTMSYELAPALGDFAPADIDRDVPLRDPWMPFLDLWHAYLRGGPEPPFSGRNNLPVFALLSAAIESVNTGRSVEIAGNPRYAAAFADGWPAVRDGNAAD